jgi:mannose-6-phosphate isomerase-like protein (cupin superfamily)
MKALYFLAAVLLSASAGAQQAPAPNTPAGNAPAAVTAEPRFSISAAEIADRISQAQAATKAGTPYRGAPLLLSGPFRAGMEYHTVADTSYAVHETAAELFVVLDGSGTLSMGGTLAGPTTRRGTNLRADTADGAIPHQLVKGDMALVPENTPHAITEVDGVLVLMTLHMPVPASIPAVAAPPAAAAPAPPPAH